MRALYLNRILLAPDCRRHHAALDQVELPVLSSSAPARLLLRAHHYFRVQMTIGRLLVAN